MKQRGVEEPVLRLKSTISESAIWHLAFPVVIVKYP